MGAEIIHIDVQEGTPCLWALVDPQTSIENRHFRIYGTGQEINEIEPIKYIGTFLLYQRRLVFHLFEVIKG